MMSRTTFIVRTAFGQNMLLQSMSHTNKKLPGDNGFMKQRTAIGKSDWLYRNASLSFELLSYSYKCTGSWSGFRVCNCFCRSIRWSNGRAIGWFPPPVCIRCTVQASNKLSRSGCPAAPLSWMCYLLFRTNCTSEFGFAPVYFRFSFDITSKIMKYFLGLLLAFPST